MKKKKKQEFQSFTVGTGIFQMYDEATAFVHLPTAKISSHRCRIMTTLSTHWPCKECSFISHGNVRGVSHISHCHPRYHTPACTQWLDLRVFAYCPLIGVQLG